MRNQNLIFGVLIGSMLITGCSTRPRNFAANLSAPVSDPALFETQYRTCENLVRSGHTSGFRAAATSLATGAGAVGTGLAVGTAVTTGGTTVGWGGVGAAAGTALAAATVVTGLVGFGITRAIRGGREHRFKQAMGSCLSEYGYGVADWEKLSRKIDAAHYSAQQQPVQTQAGALPEGEVSFVHTSETAPPAGLSSAAP